MMGYDLNTTEAAGLAELLISARTGAGLCERQGEFGGVIRDAWVHKMLTKTLPDKIEDQHHELARLSATVADLTAKSRKNAMQYLSDTGQMMERIAELTAANSALASECARLKGREVEARNVVAELLQVQDGVPMFGYDAESRADAARAYLAGGE